MTQPTPTERLTREEVELLVNGYANHIPNSEVERLAASWLEQNAALLDVLATAVPDEDSSLFFIPRRVLDKVNEVLS